MQQLIRTTIMLPESTLKMLKSRAIVEKKSVSKLLTESAHHYMGYQKTRETKKAFPKLGGFRLGIKDIYKTRDDLYGKTNR